MIRALSLVVVALLALSPAQGGTQGPAAATTGSGLILGRVVDAAGGGVEGVIVRLAGGLVPSGGVNFVQAPMPGGPRAALTNSDGRFVFPDLLPGAYSLDASKPGYISGAFGRRRPGGNSQSLTLAESERNGAVTIQMWKYAAISGRVVDEAGEPLVGVAVSALRRGFDIGHGRFTEASSSTTDDRGAYRLAALTPGDYVVAVSTTTSTVPAALADAYVDAQQAGRLLEVSRQNTASGVRGSLSLPGLAIGDQILQTAGPIFRATVVPPPPTPDGRLYAYPTTFFPGGTAFAGAQVLTLASGDERSGVDMQLRPVATTRVSGTVVGPDGPVSGIGLRLVPDAATEFAVAQIDVASTATDARGAFTFLAVPPGPYVIRVIKVPVVTPPAPSASGVTPTQTPLPAGQTLWANMPVTINDAPVNTVNVTLTTGYHIAGRFEFEGALAKPTATAMQGLVVQIQPIDGIEPTFSPVLTGQVNATGEISTYAIPPGQYSIRMASFTWDQMGTWAYKSSTLNGQDVAGQPLDLRSDVAGLVITMTDHPAEISGVARTAEGRADSTAAVLVFSTNPADWTNYGTLPRRIRNLRVSADGRFRTNSVPPGEYFIAAVPDEQAENWLDPRVLEAMSRVAVRVRLSEGDKLVHDVTTKSIK